MAKKVTKPQVKRAKQRFTETAAVVDEKEAALDEARQEMSSAADTYYSVRKAYNEQEGL